MSTPTESIITSTRYDSLSVDEILYLCQYYIPYYGLNGILLNELFELIINLLNSSIYTHQLLNIYRRTYNKDLNYIDYVSSDGNRSHRLQYKGIDRYMQLYVWNELIQCTYIEFYQLDPCSDVTSSDIKYVNTMYGRIQFSRQSRQLLTVNTLQSMNYNEINNKQLINIVATQQKRCSVLDISIDEFKQNFSKPHQIGCYCTLEYLGELQYNGVNQIYLARSILQCTTTAINSVLKPLRKRYLITLVPHYTMTTNQLYLSKFNVHHSIVPLYDEIISTKQVLQHKLTQNKPNKSQTPQSKQVIKSEPKGNDDDIDDDIDMNDTYNALKSTNIELSLLTQIYRCIDSTGMIGITQTEIQRHIFVPRKQLANYVRICREKIDVVTHNEMTMDGRTMQQRLFTKYNYDMYKQNKDEQAVNDSITLDDDIVATGTVIQNNNTNERPKQRDRNLPTELAEQRKKLIIDSLHRYTPPIQAFSKIKQLLFEYERSLDCNAPTIDRKTVKRLIQSLIDQNQCKSQYITITNTNIVVELIMLPHVDTNDSTIVQQMTHIALIASKRVVTQDVSAQAQAKRISRANIMYNQQNNLTSNTAGAEPILRAVTSSNPRIVAHRELYAEVYGYIAPRASRARLLYEKIYNDWLNDTNIVSTKLPAAVCKYINDHHISADNIYCCIDFNYMLQNVRLIDIIQLIGLFDVPLLHEYVICNGMLDKRINELPHELQSMLKSEQQLSRIVKLIQCINDLVHLKLIHKIDLAPKIINQLMLVDADQVQQLRQHKSDAQIDIYYVVFNTITLLDEQYTMSDIDQRTLYWNTLRSSCLELKQFDFIDSATNQPYTNSELQYKILYNVPYKQLAHYYAGISWYAGNKLNQSQIDHINSYDDLNKPCVSADTVTHTIVETIKPAAYARTVAAYLARHRYTSNQVSQDTIELFIDKVTGSISSSRKRMKRYDNSSVSVDSGSSNSDIDGDSSSSIDTDNESKQPSDIHKMKGKRRAGQPRVSTIDKLLQSTDPRIGSKKKYMRRKRWSESNDETLLSAYNEWYQQLSQHRTPSIGYTPVNEWSAAQYCSIHMNDSFYDSERCRKRLNILYKHDRLSAPYANKQNDVQFTDSTQLQSMESSHTNELMIVAIQQLVHNNNMAASCLNMIKAISIYITGRFDKFRAYNIYQKFNKQMITQILSTLKVDNWITGQLYVNSLRVYPMKSVLQDKVKPYIQAAEQEHELHMVLQQSKQVVIDSVYDNDKLLSHDIDNITLQSVLYRLVADQISLKPVTTHVSNVELLSAEQENSSTFRSSDIDIYVTDKTIPLLMDIDSTSIDKHNLSETDMSAADSDSDTTVELVYTAISNTKDNGIPINEACSVIQQQHNELTTEQINSAVHKLHNQCRVLTISPYEQQHYITDEFSRWYTLPIYPTDLPNDDINQIHTATTTDTTAAYNNSDVGYDETVEPKQADDTNTPITDTRPSSKVNIPLVNEPTTQTIHTWSTLDNSVNDRIYSCYKHTITDTINNMPGIRHDILCDQLYHITPVEIDLVLNNLLIDQCITVQNIYNQNEQKLSKYYFPNVLYHCNNIMLNTML